MRWRVIERIQQLLADCDEAQLKEPGDRLHTQDRITQGQYTSVLNFLAGDGGYLSKALFGEPVEGPPPLGLQIIATEGNGSTFMGLWFLSECHALLGELLETPPEDPGLRGSMEEAQAAILTQIYRARKVPLFFQGDGDDVHQCPAGTMGWYPLVRRHRLPTTIDTLLDKLLRLLQSLTQEQLLAGMANLSDGDIWAWCLSIDDLTPGIFEYADASALRKPEYIEPILGSHLAREMPEDPTLWLQDHSVALWRKLSPRLGPERGYPIETFYHPHKGPKGAFSCAVMGNILASLPLLDGGLPEAWRKDVHDTIAFIRLAVTLAMDGELKWSEYAYDYWTLPMVPIAYLLRAHRRVIELKARKGMADFPDILDPLLLSDLASFLHQHTLDLLHLPKEALLQNIEGQEGVDGNSEYGDLVYCFNGIMNLWRIAPALLAPFAAQTPTPWGREPLVEQVAKLLLHPNPSSYRAPGTGPYKLFDVGSHHVYVSMGSICFIAPPLVEAYCYYLLALQDGSLLPNQSA